MAISRFYTLIAFALCAAQLANAGIIPCDVAKPSDGPVDATTPYSPDNVHQAVSNMLIGIIELILTLLSILPYFPLKDPLTGPRLHRTILNTLPPPPFRPPFLPIHPRTVRNSKRGARSRNSRRRMAATAINPPLQTHPRRMPQCRLTHGGMMSL